MAARRDTALPESNDAAVALPACPELRVAFVLLHAQAGDDYFSDVPFLWLCGQLREDGAGADVFHVLYDRGADPEPRTQELLERLRAGLYGLVVLDQVWDARLLARIRDATGARLCATDPDLDAGGVLIDFTLRHFASHRAPLRQLVGALRAGTDLRAVPNLTLHLDTATPPLPPVRPDERFAAIPEALQPFAPATDAVVIGQPRNADGTLPRVRKSLEAATGCPFNAPVAANPAYAGVPLDAADVTLAGCAFCFMGGDYRALGKGDSVRVQLDQVAFWQMNLPRRPDGSTGLDEVVLRDQAALRYLPELIEGAVARGLQPVGFLVPGRGDSILRFGRELERAAAIAQRSGFWWTLHLIGFETFSPRQLELYNKGVTVAEYADALAQLRALHARFPAGFRLQHAGAASFILFNPWTTLDDLQETVDFCRDHAVGDLAHGLTLSRLRLYPNLPLYWKARHDGLLADGPAPTDRGAAWTGYAAEASWRYADPRIAAVEDLHRRLHAHVAPGAGVGLLAAVLAWARTLAPTAGASLDADVAAAVAGFERVRAAWRKPAPAASPAGAHVANVGPAGIRRSGDVGSGARARTVRVGSACNNHCRTCVADHASFDADPARITREVQAAAAATGRVTLAGREPTLLRFLPGLVRAAHAAGAGAAEVVTNGRALASPRVVPTLKAAGVSALLIKRHRLADADEDAFAAAPGAGAEMAAGVARARAAGLPWTLLAVVARGAEGELPALVAWAAERGARAVHVKVLAGELDLRVPDRLVEALAQAELVAATHRIGWAIEGCG
ncbi:MAG: hypothetical protein EXR79_03680 [Myxococcales bacterium]|nr:hypothetical protein [Myxococcales bacterium]